MYIDIYIHPFIRMTVKLATVVTASPLKGGEVYRPMRQQHSVVRPSTRMDSMSIIRRGSNHITLEHMPIRPSGVNTSVAPIDVCRHYNGDSLNLAWSRTISLLRSGLCIKPCSVKLDSLNRDSSSKPRKSVRLTGSDTKQLYQIPRFIPGLCCTALLVTVLHSLSVLQTVMFHWPTVVLTNTSRTDNSLI